MRVTEGTEEGPVLRIPPTAPFAPLPQRYFHITDRSKKNTADDTSVNPLTEPFLNGAHAAAVAAATMRPSADTVHTVPRCVDHGLFIRICLNPSAPQHEGQR